MSPTPTAWTPDDPCPNDGLQLVAVPAATDAMRAAAGKADSNAWIPVPPTHDSAAADFIAEHGDLYRCQGCGYAARSVAPPPAAAPAAPAPAGAPAAVQTADDLDARITAAVAKATARAAAPAAAASPASTTGE